MRLVLCVLSITFSAYLFVWKTHMLSDLDPRWDSTASRVSGSKPKGFADQMMAAMAGGGPAAAGFSTGAPATSGVPGMAGMPDTQAIQAEISRQLAGFDGGSSGAGTFSRPKEFSARFVKAHE